MRVLACFDEKNYDDTTKVYEKYNIRGIVIQDGKLAMQKSTVGEYKIPGGGVENHESFEVALGRELLEEVGLVLVKDSMKELGEITEIRRDIFEPDTKYICHSLFYSCSVTEERLPMKPTESEKKRGYHLEWETPERICMVNEELGNEPWIKRDTAFIKMLLQGAFDNLISE